MRIRSISTSTSKNIKEHCSGPVDRAHLIVEHASSRVQGGRLRLACCSSCFHRTFVNAHIKFFFFHLGPKSAAFQDDVFLLGVTHAPSVDTAIYSLAHPPHCHVWTFLGQVIVSLGARMALERRAAVHRIVEEKTTPENRPATCSYFCGDVVRELLRLAAVREIDI